MFLFFIFLIYCFIQKNIIQNNNVNIIDDTKQRKIIKHTPFYLKVHIFSYFLKKVEFCEK